MRTLFFGCVGGSVRKKKKKHTITLSPPFERVLLRFFFFSVGVQVEPPAHFTPSGTFHHASLAPSLARPPRLEPCRTGTPASKQTSVILKCMRRVTLLTCLFKIQSKAKTLPQTIRGARGGTQAQKGGKKNTRTESEKAPRKPLSP